MIHQLQNLKNFLQHLAFEILEQYPNERSLIVDYLTLEMFDPDLADLLIEKPE